MYYELGVLADNDPRLNPNGGSIAIGHPLGVTGTRIAYSAALELHEQHKTVRFNNDVYWCWSRLCSNN